MRPRAKDRMVGKTRLQKTLNKLSTSVKTRASSIYNTLRSSAAGRGITTAVGTAVAGGQGLFPPTIDVGAKSGWKNPSKKPDFYPIEPPPHTEKMKSVQKNLDYQAKHGRPPGPTGKNTLSKSTGTGVLRKGPNMATRGTSAGRLGGLGIGAAIGVGLGKKLADHKPWANFVTSHGLLDSKIPDSKGVDALVDEAGEKGLWKKQPKGKPPAKKPPGGGSPVLKEPPSRRPSPEKKPDKGLGNTVADVTAGTPVKKRKPKGGTKVKKEKTGSTPVTQEQKGFQWNTGTTALAAGLGGALVGSYLAGRKQTNITINNTPVMKKKYYYR